MPQGVTEDVSSPLADAFARSLPLPTHHPTGDEELLREALLAEQEFAWSLIRTYREFQMQAVGFAIGLHAAVLGLIGSAIDSSKLMNVESYCTALLPYPTAILVLAFAVMEVRIRRASQHSTQNIAPKLNGLRVSASSPAVLEWEADPSCHLSRFERAMANSTVFVLAMSLPAFGGAAWHLFARAIPVAIWQAPLAIIGIIVLGVSTVIACNLSITHENRLAAKLIAPRPEPGASG